MIYFGVAVVLAIVALLVALLALRLLLGTSWLAWLRGTAGLLILATATALGLAAWDVAQYRQVNDKPLATLAFSKLDAQHFAVKLVDQTGAEQRYELSGDMWQLDLRVLTWPSGLARIGIGPGYQLDRVAGRYLSLEDQQKQPHTAVVLREDSRWFDLWESLQRIDPVLSPLTAERLTASYQPMADGALYSVNLSGKALVVQPLNDRAEAALARWQ